MPQEIERKFLVKVTPENLNNFPRQEIRQGYVSIDNNGTEVRIRKMGSRYFQTVKAGTGKIRPEIEVEITREQFDILWPTTEDKRVEKTRYRIPYTNNLTLELDVFKGRLEGFVCVEVEFPSIVASNLFITPEWFGEEITDDHRYKNQSLALYGLPEEIYVRQEDKNEYHNIPTFPLAEGLAWLIGIIPDELARFSEPLIIKIAGGSASGKTTAVSAKLRNFVGSDSVVISMDDYYRGQTWMEREAEKGNILNLDQPEALNMDLFRFHLIQLKSGKPIQKPVYDFVKGEAIETEEILPKRIIIIEGLFALHDSLKDIGNISVFVDRDTHARVLRRLIRDPKRTGQKPSEILRQIAEIVLPMHDKYVEGSKKNADVIIQNDYLAEIESKKSGSHEVQLKFPVWIDAEYIEEIGADRLGTIFQSDTYYSPPDRDLIKTGEIMRIRHEGSRRILTYKGTKVESEFRERPKLEFEIDEKMERQFLRIYGNKVKIIKKERTLYQLDGVTFSLDVVSKISGYEITDLGSFIEIRLTDKLSERHLLDGVLEKLGLKIEQGIKDSYFEM
jgi:adenylate cyclase